MAPQVILIRHAQGQHNVSAEHLHTQDPRLTELGLQQCDILRTNTFPDQSTISLITASPLTRTIHTAARIFGPALTDTHLKCHKQIIAIADAQETSDYPCDTGSDLESLRLRCHEEKWPVDLTTLEPDWHIKKGRNVPTPMAIRARAQSARQRIRTLLGEMVRQGDEDAQVVLVTHGGYLHYFTEDWEDANKLHGTGWHNCEVRRYEFETGVGGNDEVATLKETAASRTNRGKKGAPWTKEQQIKEFDATHPGWDEPDTDVNARM